MSTGRITTALRWPRLSASQRWGMPVAAATVLGVLAPIFYLVLRAADADVSRLDDLVFRARHLWLLWNTLALAAGVLVVGTLIATPLAWLVTRSDLPPSARRLVTLVAVTPLAIPGYVMAYALLGLTGPTGVIASLTGVVVPRPSGYVGSLIALSLYLFPYLFLNLRAAMRSLDPTLEESARALGSGPWEAFWRVTVPQLRPAMGAASLMVLLHVLADFGVVSLMRYETFSYALYLLHTMSFDRVYSSWLALIMLALAAAVLLVEARVLRGLRLDRAGKGAGRGGAPVELGRWTWPALAGVGIVALVAVVLPIVSILYWTLRGTAGQWGEVLAGLAASLEVSIPAAVLAPLLALPLVYVSVRQPSRASAFVERVAYFGYATPPLAFGLAVTFFSLRAAPWLYQTLALLVFAYAIHFVAEALGPIRASMHHASPRLTESARALGYGPFGAFFRVTLPLIRPGVLSAAALVFLSAMKELPLTLMLAPPDFSTLAMGVWDKTRESLLAEAAPMALAIVGVSCLFVAVILGAERAGAAKPRAAEGARGDAAAAMGLAPAS